MVDRLGYWCPRPGRRPPPAAGGGPAVMPPIERFAARPEMRPHQTGPLQIGRPTHLELRAGHHPAGRHRLAQRARRRVTVPVTGIQLEQDRHRLHRVTVGLEISTDIHKPRQRR